MGTLCGLMHWIITLPRAGAVLTVVLFLAGCFDTPHPVDPSFVASRDEAAATLVSVTMVAAWDSVADAVQPNFVLTSDAALREVVPVTQRIQEQTLSAFGLGASLGYAPTIAAQTPVVGVYPDGGAGTDAAAPTSTAIPLPSTQGVAGDVALDPILKYQSALALYQTVQLMNKQVQFAASVGCFVPFLVQLKLAVMPYRRNLPYDIHARIAFFPKLGESPAAASAPIPPITEAKEIRRSAGAPVQGSCADVGEMPFVLPLLVTDDIERTLKSRAAETSRQLALALSAITHGVGASAGANAVNQHLAAIGGQDLNSRLTVARQSDNTLYVRIGASNQASAGFALVGQTYDVALLLLVPQRYFSPELTDPIVNVHMYPEFRNALNGSVLSRRSRETLVKQSTEALDTLLLGPSLKAWDESSTDYRESVIRNLAAPVIENKWTDYARCLAKTKLPNGVGLDLPLGNQRALWVLLSKLVADTAVTTTFFELRRPPKVEVPAQTALLFDDGKATAQVQLHDAEGVSSRSLSASLHLKTKTGEYQLAAQSISYDASMGTLSFAFPSLAKWGLGELDFRNSTLELKQRCSQTKLCPEFDVPASFTLLKLGTDASDDQPRFELLANVRQIVAKDGQAALTVTVDKMKDDAVVLSVTNADVVSAVEDNRLGLPVSSKNDVTIAKAGAVTFKLRNVRTGMVVGVEAHGKKGEKATGKRNLDFFVVGS